MIFTKKLKKNIKNRVTIKLLKKIIRPFNKMKKKKKQKNKNKTMIFTRKKKINLQQCKLKKKK